MNARCLHEIFTARADEAPDRIAVSTPDHQITYGELDRRAGWLAQRLRGLGVGPDRLVGLCVDRSAEMIVGLLAILKAGGAYLPLDPAYPPAWLRFLLADSGAAVVVSVSRVAACLEEGSASVVLMDVDEPGPAAVSACGQSCTAVAENLAYVIYTSGSTGTPKGVLIEHRNVVRLFERTQLWFRFDERDVWTLFHSASFDFSVWEIWGALLYGGRLVVVPAEVARAPAQFRLVLGTQGVTVLNQTPSALRQLLATDGPGAGPSSLRLVISGGEALDVRLLEPWLAPDRDRQPAVVNMYGITETTVHVTCRQILAADLAHPGVSPIGVPIPDLGICLLDAAGREVRDGTPGEIHVRGAGLARGYLNRPELTAEHFIPGPDGTRLYRSGDRAVRTSDGGLAYLGRADGQMKVRGFRIEAREVESCLAAHPEVVRAIATLHDYGDGDVRLVAFVLARSALDPGSRAADVLAAGLAARASAELPAHMRPSAYRVLSEIPMTTQGKVDHAALRGLLEPTGASGGGATGGMTATERAIVRIVEQILGRKGISTDDDLFDLGGTSLAVVRIIRQTNQCFHVSLNGSELGEQATIARVAACVEAELRALPSEA